MWYINCDIYGSNYHSISLAAVPLISRPEKLQDCNLRSAYDPLGIFNYEHIVLLLLLNDSMNWQVFQVTR